MAVEIHTPQASTGAAPKIGMISLGCPKALVDSERILTQLRLEGYEVSPSYEGADVVVVNTCGFIDSAVAESFDAIGEAMRSNGKVIVTGCLGAKSGDVLERYPDVLAVSGPQAYESVVDAVHQHVPAPMNHDPFTSLVPPQGIKLTPRHYAYLKISEGCNHKCTFCIIPSMRGKLVSRPIGEVLDEAQRLVDSGVKELLVISQDTSAYGVDLKYKMAFWQGRPVKGNMLELCRQLGQLRAKDGSKAWVRLHYVYPYPHVDDVIPLMAEGLVVPYLDIPFQHASQKVLRAMKRPAYAENTLARIKLWRSICPELIIRSTFIVGFPGETEEDFQILLNFLDEAQLDRVGCFAYSPVEGATANELADPVPEDVKQERLARFMAKQAVISEARLKNRIGEEIDVLIDEVVEEGIVGRSKADAPEIDGQVFVDHRSTKDRLELKPGQVIRVRVIDSDEHDLWGEHLA
ncbi:30S ribosomal protein S12 methylthiotransferase RimO [Allohahella sp. A8]|uniref:30S ribosomal protein S12 methylthiotransferase RimO n=1 Tax=Allohahella sp. A8 TaxID=3141461 RepID=UPI003A8101C2